MEDHDPNLISFDVLHGIAIGESPVKMGEVQLGYRDRIRFLFSGRVSLYQLPERRGSRFTLHAPQFRNFPLTLISWVSRAKD
jgi:hypothetical protein